MAVFYEQGRYRCQITDQAIGEANTGTPQIAIKFRVLETEIGEPVDQQYERTAYLFITENAAARTIEVLKELGFSKGSFKFVDKSVEGYHDFTGQEITAFCTHDTYNNQVKEKWGIAIGGGPLEVKPMESRKIRELDSLFGKALTGGARPTQSRTAAAVADHYDEGPPNLPTTDDDVPF